MFVDRTRFGGHSAESIATLVPPLLLFTSIIALKDFMVYFPAELTDRFIDHTTSIP